MRNVRRFVVVSASVLVMVPLGRAEEPDTTKDVALSPACWADGDLQKFEEFNQRFNANKPLASGQNVVITGTTNASAVRAGLEALSQGGTAADAAITTSLAQITQAQGAWVSFAGIFTMVYYDAETETVYNLNGGYNTVLDEDDPQSIPRPSPSLEEPQFIPRGRTVLVPGYMRAIEAAHKRFGKLPFDALFQPAIYFAENGFRLTILNDRMMQSRRSVLSRRPSAKSIFVKEGGFFPRQGELFKQPELAETLKNVASQGANYMYEGAWGKKFVDAVRQDGGKITIKDMTDYRAEWTEPVKISYGGHTILAHGLPAQGGVHLAEALNVATCAKLADKGYYADSPEAFFWLAQIDKLFAFSHVTPLIRAMLLQELDTSLERRASMAHAEHVWELMQRGKLTLTQVPKQVTPKHSDAIVVIDRWGNMAAVVHTINTVTWGETGIFVGGVSVPDSASIQQLLIAETGPGKRLPDPTEPLIVLHGDQPVLALSSIGGGLHQTTMSALINYIDFDKDLEESIEAPSFHLPKFGEDGKSTAQVFEGRFPAAVITGARKLGLAVEEVPKTEASIRGYVVGASIDPDSGLRKAVTLDRFNGRAIGQGGKEKGRQGEVSEKRSSSPKG